MSNTNRHQVKCDRKVKFNLPGGIYKNNPSVFEDMERLGCQNIEEEVKLESGLRVSILRCIDVILIIG